MKRVMVIACAAAGCRAHVQLAAPPAGAPEGERIAAYARLRPGPIGFEYHKGAAVDSHVELGDGTRIGYAADLEPVVLPSSQTAAYAARAASAREHRNRWTMVAVGIFAATVTAGTVESEVVHDPWRMLGAEWGTLLVGALLEWRTYRHLAPYSRDAFDAQAAAFDGYDADLRARLDVCVDGLRVTACDR